MSKLHLRAEPSGRAIGDVVGRAERRDGPEQPRPISPLFARLARLPPHLLPWQRETVPWAFGAVEYAERYWSLAREAWRWRLAFFAVLGMCAVSVWSVVSLARSTRVVPYVVQVDQHGYAVAIRPAEKTGPADERVVMASVARWVRSMRTVLGDAVAQRALIDDAYAMLAPGTQATEKASDWYRANNPLDAKGRHVDVQISKVSPMRSAAAINVEWSERARDGAGLDTVSRFSAFVEVEISPTLKLDDVMANPLGVFVTDYSISQL